MASSHYVLWSAAQVFISLACLNYGSLFYCKNSIAEVWTTEVNAFFGKESQSEYTVLNSISLDRRHQLIKAFIYE